MPTGCCGCCGCGLWCVLAACLMVLLGAVAAAACARRRRAPIGPEEQRKILQTLRAGLMASPSLVDRHPEAVEVLRKWKLVPDAQSARTDLASKSIRMPVVHNTSGEAYDRVTLILVLLHELAHATDTAPQMEHDDGWAQRQAEYVTAAVDDGLLLPWQEADPDYPAQIILSV